MTNKLNSASRLHRILVEANSCSGTATAVDIWAELFRVRPDNSVRRAIAVTQYLSAMHRELEIARDGMATLNFPINLYEHSFSRIEAAISPLYLSSSWMNVTQQLSSDVIVSLAYCAEILPDEENQISEDELQVIRDKLKELREAALDSSIPTRLKALIDNHAELIEKALADYFVSGAKALRVAGRTALGEMIEVRDEVRDGNEGGVVEKLSSAWKAVNSAADAALKGEKLIQLGQKAWDAVNGFI